MSESEKSSHQDVGLFSRTLKILAIPTSLAAGLFYSSGNVRNQNYNNLRNRGIFKELKDSHDIKVRDLMPKAGEVKDVSEDLKSLNKALSSQIDKRIEDMGLGSFRKKFSNLHYNQKVESVIGAMTVSTLVLGAMLAIADHKSIAALMNDKSNSQGLE
jgi:hypothetical protein